jgi:hypothetical protein
MATDRFLIAPMAENSGLQTNVKPWLIPDEAFSQLNNAYVFRGRVRKRFGSRWIGQSDLASRLRILIGTITSGSFAGSIATILADAGFPTNIGQSFSIGDFVFTVYNTTTGPQQMLRTDNSVSTATYDLSNSNFNITGVALPDATDVYFYPSFPVMGLLTYEQISIADEYVIAFDTRYAYRYSMGGWNRLSTENPVGSGASVWTGENWQFFWGDTWVGVNPSDKIFFTTNFNIPDGIRYFDGTTWNKFNYYFSIGAFINTTDGSGYATGTVSGGAIGQTFVIGNTLFTVVVADGVLAVKSLTTAPAVGTGVFNITSGAYTFTGAQVDSLVYFSAGNIINTAKIIVPFKNRLVLFDTVEAGIRYSNRARYSQVGSPLDPAAWFQDYPGRGNTIDASTTEAIISVEFIKDRLIVFFERSTWELVYQGNQAYPFTWQQINTELGAESTFSVVPFDKVAIAVGNVGIHACNGANVERIDDKIPTEVFEVHNNGEGVNRVYGIRDYFVEMVYWTFPDTQADANIPYPNRVLVFNYATGTWSLNDDTITCFGYFQPFVGVLWDSTTVTWDDDVSWNSGAVQARFRQVIGGNQQGYTFICDADIPVNALVLQITNVVVNVGSITLTVIEHNLEIDDYIFILGAVWSDDSNGLNGEIFKIVNIVDINTFIIALQLNPNNPPVNDPVTGTYMGGGLISTVSQIAVTTKEYNFYAKQGRNAAISKIDFMVDSTPAGQMQVEFYASTSTVSLLDDSSAPPLGNGSLLGTGTLDTYPYPDIEFEAFATRLQHPVYFQANGEVVQLQLIMNDGQLRSVPVMQSGFQLHAMTIYSTPTSYRFQ